MSNRRYRPQFQEIDEIGNDFDQRRFAQADIMTNPLMRSGFQFEELDEKYPLLPIQAQQARDKNKRLKEQEIEYKKTILAERMSEIEIKKASRDLDMFEATINREDAMLEQVPLARQALGELDPRDPNYIKKRMDVYNEYPLAFEDEKFVNTVDKPLLYRNQQLSGARRSISESQQGSVNRQDYKDAMNEITKYMGISENRDLAKDEKNYIADMQYIIDSYRAQSGANASQQAVPSLSTEPTEEAIETEQMNIPSPEEDEKIYSEAMDVIARNPALKDKVNQRLIQMGRKPID
jgi:hypothetical protein